MAALKDVARDVADEIREGIAWVIIYRTGRSWHSLSVWSDLWTGDWETDDLNDALAILKADPNAIALNGYYCGHLGGEDATVEQIAAGIRWHYENERNLLADRQGIEQAQESIEEARTVAKAAGIPFSEKLVDGAEGDPDPYTYDGSMSVEDYDAMQADRATHEGLADVVAAWAPGLPADKVDELAAAVVSLHITPEVMQRILEAFDQLAETAKRIADELVRIFRPIVDWASKMAERLVEALAAGIVPRKWLHLAKHAKKARTRKKYRNRIRRSVVAALAAEGGGSS